MNKLQLVSEFEEKDMASECRVLQYTNPDLQSYEELEEIPKMMKIAFKELEKSVEGLF